MRCGRVDHDLDAVGELHPLDQLWQLFWSVEPAPAFLLGLGELEDHRERRRGGNPAQGAPARGATQRAGTSQGPALGTWRCDR